MGDWQPQVVKIEKIEKHPNADLLSIATVLGDYPVIIKTGQYQVGNLAAYLPIDTVCPDTEQFYFLCPKAYERYEEDGEIKQRQVGNKYLEGQVPEKYRILKAKRIRNIFSMGMLVDVPAGLTLGDLVIDVLQLKKWEEDIDDGENHNAPKLKGRNAASPPKGWAIPYYDIEGLRKYINCIGENEEVVLTEKVNGSNASYCWDGEKLWQKSRNFYKKPDPDDSWVAAGIRYDLENKLKNYPMMVFFCELHGQVKNFRYDLQIENGQMHLKLRFFDIYDVKNNKFLDYDDLLLILNKLNLDPVPELYRGKWLGKENMYPYAEGNTTLGGTHLKEGFVMKPIKERFEPKLGGRMILKLVGEGYNLSK